MPLISQKGFPRGEISPYLYTRPEVEDYPYAARKLENFIITKEGVAESRPGTEYIDECRSPGTEKRGIPFIFSTSTGDTYALEFGHEYMEVIRAGGRILETAKVITGASQSNPCILTMSTAHSLTAGDHVYIEDVVGMTQLNGRRYIVGTPSTTTLSLQDVHGANIDSSAFIAYSSGGTAARIYVISTPYQEDDLQRIKFTQSADVMYLTHPSYTRRKLSRTGHTSWTLAEVTEGPGFDGPAALAVTAGGSGGGLTYEYQVTALKADNSESLPGFEAAKAISGATAANPVVITTATHGYSDGEQVLIRDVVGMTELNERRFTVRVTGYSSTTFALVNVDGTSYTAYVSGGNSYRTSDVITNANAPTTSAPITLAWSAVADAERYAIYRKLSGFYGFVGYSTSLAFSDPNITPDTSQGPPQYSEEFLTEDDQPGAVTIHQQRVVYGGSVNEADAVKSSKIGGYDDFSTHNPLVDSDPVEFTLASTEVNPIIHLVSLRRLIALTGASEWAIEGDSSGTLTPSAINARQYTNSGASHVRPAVVGNSILYVQARGSTIQALSWDFDDDSYVSQDVTLKSSHLFRGYSIRDMAYQKIPNSILWVVRSDGKLLALTYNPDVKILAWTGHTVSGSFSDGDAVVENVVSIPENDSEDVGGEDAVYLLVKRTVNGLTVRYWERLRSRVVDQDVRDRYTFLGPDHQQEFSNLDSFLTYDGLNVGAGTITLSGADYSAGEEVTATASVSGTFLSTDVGEDETSRKFYLWASDDTLIRCTVTGYTNDTTVTVRVHADVPDELQATATTSWGVAVRRVTGLWHLEGEDVSALGDGFVAANAFLDTTPVTVEDGAAVFGEFYTVLHVGLPYICDLELLDLEPSDGETLYGIQKTVSGVGVYVKESHSFYAGMAFPDEDSDDYTGPTQDLDRAEDVDSDEDDADYPPPLRTELIKVAFNSEPRAHGRAVIRHLEPRPLTILAVARVVEVHG